MAAGAVYADDPAFLTRVVERDRVPLTVQRQIHCYILLRQAAAGQRNALRTQGNSIFPSMIRYRRQHRESVPVGDDLDFPALAIPHALGADALPGVQVQVNHPAV